MVSGGFASLSIRANAAVQPFPVALCEIMSPDVRLGVLLAVCWFNLLAFLLIPY